MTAPIGNLDKVAVFTETTGQSDIVMGDALDTSYFTEVEAGAVDSASYYLHVQDGLDFEIVLATYTAATRTMVLGTPTKSKISGTVGTTKMSLSGSATVRVVSSVEILARKLDAGQDLADLDSVPTARDNLGLGDSATKNVGTAAGTVAAGDDSRIVGAAQSGDLGGAALLDVGTTAGTVAAGDDARIVGAVRSDAAQSLSTSAQAQARTNISAVLKGHLYGLTLSNNTSDATNDIDIAVGEAASTETDPALMVLAAAITKRLDAAWAVGTNQGGLDTGSIADALYYVWLIQRSDTGVVDVLFSASATSPTMPANYDRKRRIGAFFRASSAILSFKQTDDDFDLLTPFAANSGSAVSVGVSRVFVALKVPPGMKAKIRVYAYNASSGGVGFLIQDPSETDTSPGTFASLFAETANQGGAGEFVKMTDGSGQIAVRAQAASSTMYIKTLGWIDNRGRV